jgi:hypothetical protein
MEVVDHAPTEPEHQVMIDFWKEFLKRVHCLCPNSKIRKMTMR